MPKKISPHLPAPTCSLKNHQLWRRLKFLFFITSFSLLVGMSGASMVLGWIWPTMGSADTWIASYQRPAITKIQLEEKIRKEVLARMVTVYSKTSKVSSLEYLDNKTRVGDAVIISSDGWTAMYVGVGATSFEADTDYLALTPDGKIYKTTKSIFDQYTGMLYIKMEGSQFKVINFSEQVKNGDNLFVYQNLDWQSAVVGGGLYYANASPHLDSASVTTYPLNGSFEKGAIVINDQGRIAGLVTANNKIIPNLYITRILAGFLDNQIIEYHSLGIEGWFGAEKPIIIDNEAQDGFAVSKVWSTNSLLQIGDIILQINGAVVNEANLWYIITNNQEANLKIIRADKILQIKTPVVKKIIK